MNVAQLNNNTGDNNIHNRRGDQIRKDRKSLYYNNIMCVVPY